MKLWLLRHAQVLVEAGLCYGASDVPADPVHTQASAQAVAPLLPTGLSWRVSGLGRAQQLAQALRPLRPDLPGPQVDVRLNEMDFGCWELHAWDAIPPHAFDEWMANFAHHRFGGVESTQSIIDRVADALDEQRSAGDAVWVTHAGVIRAVQFVAARGRGPIRGVEEWPREAPGPGGWLSLEL